MRIVVFGHDADDAMLARRIAAMEALGHTVTAYTMRRGPQQRRTWDNHDLGQTHDGQMLHRLWALWKGLGRGPSPATLAQADLIWARNLDMLLLARAALRRVRKNIPIAYEALDIHWSLSQQSLRGALMRATERWAMASAHGLITSSPGFIQNYFARYQKDHPPVHLLENKVPSDRLPARPSPNPRGQAEPTPPLRVGFVGALRCERSFTLLAQTANMMDGAISVHLHGKVSDDGIPNFEERIKASVHMTYYGPYQSPEDLEAVYSTLDIVWAGDYLMAGKSSSWSLVNRLYEGGYFGVPCLAPGGTQTAKWIEQNRTGLTLSDPCPNTLCHLLRQLMKGDQLYQLRRQVLAVPTHIFSQGNQALEQIIQTVANTGRRSE
ncbi:MAG: glycosyltransferase [Pseudomonadota bacterium]